MILDCPAPRTIMRMAPDLVVALASDRAVAVQIAAAVALRWPDAEVKVTTTEVEIHADAATCSTIEWVLKRTMGVELKGMH